MARHLLEKLKRVGRAPCNRHRKGYKIIFIIHLYYRCVIKIRDVFNYRDLIYFKLKQNKVNVFKDSIPTFNLTKY